MSPSIRDVVTALQGIIENGRSEIDAALAAEDLALTAILDHYSNNLDVGMFPILMIDQARETSTWVAMPEVQQDEFELNLWFFLHHDDPQLRHRAIGNAAAALKSVVNRRHRPFDLGNGYELYFNDTVPIKRIDYGGSILRANVFVHGFQATFVSHVSYDEVGISG